MKPILRPVLCVGTAAALVASIALAAGDLEKPPAEVDAVLKKYLAATGGEAAVRKHTSRSVKGTVKLLGAGGMELTVTTLGKAPNKELQTIDLPQVGPMVVGYDGQTGWAKAGGTLNEVQGDQLKSVKRDADFWRPIEIPRLLKKLRLAGEKTVGGVPSVAIEGENEDGKTERVYFARDTGLMTAWDYEVFVGSKFEPSQVLFGDYREVDGVKVAFKISAETPAAAAFEFKVSELKLDTNPPDEVFHKPASAN